MCVLRLSLRRNCDKKKTFLELSSVKISMPYLRTRSNVYSVHNWKFCHVVKVVISYEMYTFCSLRRIFRLFFDLALIWHHQWTFVLQFSLSNPVRLLKTWKLSHRGLFSIKCILFAVSGGVRGHFSNWHRFGISEHLYAREAHHIVRPFLLEEWKNLWPLLKP